MQPAACIRAASMNYKSFVELPCLPVCWTDILTYHSHWIRPFLASTFYIYTVCSPLSMQGGHTVDSVCKVWHCTFTKPRVRFYRVGLKGKDRHFTHAHPHLTNLDLLWNVPMATADSLLIHPGSFGSLKQRPPQENPMLFCAR